LDRAANGDIRLYKKLKDKTLLKYAVSSLILEDHIGHFKLFRGLYNKESVIIKEINFKAFDETSWIYLKREISIMSTVSHPNVVHCIAADISNKNDIGIIVHKSYKNSLEDLRKERPTWSVKRVLSVAKDVTDGMAYLSSVGIIHRTLSPINILLDSKNTALISDYGLARVEDFKKQGYMTKGLGVPLYEAPELMVSVGDYGTEVDVYSFGIILWELLTNRVPYDHLRINNTTEFLFPHVVGGKRPQTDNAEVFIKHPQITELMMKCWAKNSAERPKFEYLAQVLSDYIIDMEMP